MFKINSGTIGLVDYDTVDVSNLQRQVLHREDNIGMSKVQSAIYELKRYFFNFTYCISLCLNGQQQLINSCKKRIF